MSSRPQPENYWRPPVSVEPCEQRRIDIDARFQPNFSGEHRSGWAYALESLWPLHAAGGVLLDSFVERTFAWHEPQERNRGRIPYRRPWIGVLHNPAGIPEWHDFDSAPDTIIARPTFKESLPHCRGLIVLSEHMRQWLSPRVPVPVVALRHPTEIPCIKFDVSAFLKNPKRRLVQVGWWLRWLHSIYQVEAPSFRKSMLVVRNPHFTISLKREQDVLGLRSAELGEVDKIPFLADADYDHLLSRNVVFCHLIDSSANNVVIECIARNTPLAVNPLPAVVEYLGADYPLYFSSLDEASQKLRDLDRVIAAHEYLRTLRKSELAGTYFRDSFVRSDVYRPLLEAPA